MGLSRQIGCDECVISTYDEDQALDKYFCPILELFMSGYGTCDPAYMIGRVFKRLLALEKEVGRLKRKGSPMR